MAFLSSPTSGSSIWEIRVHLSQMPPTLCSETEFQCMFVSLTRENSILAKDTTSHS